MNQILLKKEHKPSIDEEKPSMISFIPNNEAEENVVLKENSNSRIKKKSKFCFS